MTPLSFRRFRAFRREATTMAMMLAVFALSVAVLGYSSTFPGADNFRSGNWVPGPAFFPCLLAVMLILASGIELTRAMRRRGRREPEVDPATGEKIPVPPKTTFREWITDRGTHNAAIVLAILFAFPFLLEPVGFAIMGFAAVFTITWRLKAGPVMSAVFAALSVGLTMVFFKYVFYMDLPPGVWSPTLMF